MLIQSRSSTNEKHEMCYNLNQGIFKESHNLIQYNWLALQQHNTIKCGREPQTAKYLF